MYAIFKSGGKQYKACVDDVLKIEKIEADEGSTQTINDVLLVGNQELQVFGTPTVKNAKIEFTVTNQARNRKIIVFKKKRRQNYRRKKGHRQFYTEIKINKIIADGFKNESTKSTVTKNVNKKDATTTDVNKKDKESNKKTSVKKRATTK